MKAQSFEYRLRHTNPPAPDSAARLRARRAALAELERISVPRSQPRTVPQTNPKGFWSSRNALLGGLASACVVVIAVSVAWLIPPEQRELTRHVPVASHERSVVERPLQAEKPTEDMSANAKRMESETKTADPTASALRTQRRQPPSLPMQKPAVPPIEAGSSDKLEETVPPPEIVIDIPRRSERIADVPMSIATVNAPLATPSSRAEVDEIAVTANKASRSRLGRLFARKDAADSESARQVMHQAEGRDRFEHFDPNDVKQVSEEPLSTFSADVDTSSYSFVRKQLNHGALPQKDAVRVEEMINYFDYAWPAPGSRARPFQPTVVVSDSPWGKGRKLVHIGIKGYKLAAQQRPDANLVMLLDVSGSMNEPDKLPLVKQSMKLLLGSLQPTDTVAIVVYAGAAGEVLPPTPVGEKEKIVAALDRLEAGGSTAGAAGIELAYQLAERSFRKEGLNRILLCTDGDFNVGIDSTDELKGYVERQREKGVFLSVLGFGQGNYRDELAQALAQNGNGVAAYIDTLNEAQKVLVQEASSSLFTIAKDVKLQVEFNPAAVAEYRLVGYETRALKDEDFNNDAVDAGEIGAGHTVTAIYEITPVGVEARMVDERRYGKKKETSAVAGKTSEYGFLKIRYKLPESRKSLLIEQPIHIAAQPPPDPIARDVRFSTAVAGFAQLLRGGAYTGSLSYDDVIKQALASRGEDPYGYRNEFVQLVRKAQVAGGM
jgi:Ca-activated chloride channel homolog